ncbi:MAG: histidine kinase [Clostridia bacterium]|nr:histidine kinase [Clostridia bacterium]
MITWFTVFTFSVISAALLIALLGMWLTIVVPILDKWSKRFFLAYFAVLLLCSLVSLADMLLLPYSGETAERIFGFVECLLLSAPLPMLTAYLLNCCKKVVKRSPLFRTVLGFWAVYFVLLVSTFFTEHIYYITPNAQFQRGAWFPLLIVPLNAIMILNLVSLIRWRGLLSRRYFLGFLIAILPLSVAMFVHTFTDVTPLIDISTVLSAVSMFGLILAGQIEDHLRQQEEIAQQRASISVLQMRPHFIYNTMMSIYYLIAQDTEKAQKITLDFTTYLRKNFTALAKDQTVPFTEELEHTRAYLAVEKTRFEDNLFIEFDTPHTRFRIPPLTLQPIVENAIKHGLDPELSPLHITIKTRGTENGSEITVEDTGPGFTENDNNEPHVALANIKERLKMMCRGTLTIAPRAGGGTVVTVVIPQ